MGEQDSVNVLIIDRNNNAEQVIETIQKHGKKVKIVKIIEVPSILPDFIDEDMENYISLSDIPEGVDILYPFTAHPDFSIHSGFLAKNRGIPVLLFPEIDPITRQLGLKREVERITEGKVCVIAPKTTCSITPSSTLNCSKFNIFAEELGVPELSVKIDEKTGTIEKIVVHRGAPCGATWGVAKLLIGTHYSDAVRRAGLLTQSYCAGTRGYDLIKGAGSIYTAAKIHAKAVERALKKALKANK